MKALTKIGIGFLALAAAALWFTSCSSEDVASGTNQGKMSSLTLTINTGKSMGSRATDWATDDPAGAKKEDTENKINRITVGIFGPDDNVKTIVELTANDQTVNGNKLTLDGKTATIVTSSLTPNDKVLVAVNAKSGTFNGVQTATKFKEQKGGLDFAVTSNGDKTKEINTNIPMYGEGSLQSEEGGTSKFRATINVSHLLAKVTLDEVKVEFDKNGAYKDASFTPKDVFLVNVPTEFIFSGSEIADISTATNNDKAWVSTPTYINGFDKNTTYSSLTNVTVPSTWGNYEAYLTTGLWDAGILQNKEPENSKASKKAYFYITPNGNDGDETKTKLIISGTFKKNVDDEGTTVFYPLALNAVSKSDGSYDAATNGGQDKFKVYPNKNYVCKVVIRNIGSLDPTKSLDPQIATITVTVKDFEEATQTTEFN